MKRTIPLLCAVFLFTSSVVQAADAVLDQPPPEPEKTVEPVIAPVNKSQGAPFAGVLLSPEAVAETIADKEFQKQQQALDTQKAVDTCRADNQKDLALVKIASEADQKVLQAQLDSQTKQANQLNESLKKEVESRPNVVLWTAGGALVGVVVTTLVIILTK